MGDISGAADAFSIGGFTLDPQLAAGGEGFDRVTPLASSPPLLEIGGSSLGDPTTAATTSLPRASTCTAERFERTEIGTITTGEDVTNLLGFTNTQLIVTGATASRRRHRLGPADSGIGLDAFNLGNGYENVYTAIPGADGAKTPSPTRW